MTGSPSISAIVLAGGQSRRMGQDKALLLVDGVPMVQRICEMILNCTTDVKIVTAWPDRYGAIVPAACQFIPETVAAGPLTAFATGLATVQTEWVLLLACDLPYLTVATVREWMIQLPKDPSVMAVLPIGEKGWEPLCGFYRVQCRENLEAAIAAGIRSFQHWLAHESVQVLSVSDRSVLIDWDTPDDVSD